MAAYDFPDTAGKPTDGSFEYTAPDGTLYEWNGYAWVVPADESSGGGGGGAARVLTQVLPPSPAEDGDMYWCTDDGRLYLYYDDADTKQWVDASPDGGGSSPATYWDRNGTTLSPSTAGDDVDLGNIQLDADGTGTFLGTINSTRTTGSAPCFNSFTSGDGNPTSQILADGRAAFAGTIKNGEDNPTDISYVGRRGVSVNKLGCVTTWNETETLSSGGSGSDNFFTGYSSPDSTSAKTIKFNVDTIGNVRAAGDIFNGDLNTSSGTTGGTRLYTTGQIYAQVPGTSSTTAEFFRGYYGTTRTAGWYTDGTLQIGGSLPSSPNISLNADGSAGFYNTQSDKYNFDLQNGTSTWGLGLYGSQTSFYVFNVNSTSGVQLAAGATAWSPSTSESRLKNILGDVDEVQAWELVKNIELKRYQYKEGEDLGISYAGPMADWLGKQDPELLIDTGRSDDEGPIHTYNQGLLDTKALQALSTALTRIETLEETNASLEVRLTALEGGNN